MTFSQLQVFTKVVETGSFTKAGEALRMTQSAVSHAIANMESELGVPLIIRDKKQGIILSDFGKHILKLAGEILNRIDQIEQAAASEKGLDVGTIRIGSFPSATARLLPKIISKFKQQYPRIEVVLFDGDDHEVSEWLNNRVIDVGFVAQLGRNDKMIPLTKDKMVAVIPKGYQFGDAQAIPVWKLSDSPFIMSKGGCEPFIREIFAHAGLSPSVQFEARDTNTMLNMVQEGLGITIVPELALPDKLPDIEVRDLDPTFWRYLGLYCPHVDEVTPAIQKFISMGQSLFQALEQKVEDV
ncbi:LysR family transcriptional regulator [Paenibacillus beijingensis]|uniref:HTH lysR-type domain-containing protein n=1 Tax=Paenibacillus beijingensis TaxID=1126833 RepID=A0A0D5NJN9_9BACL|nr:LysR family transcriptional regulator [Paenibacillus beijingensis]AJY75330.1 hypothetical protein VN24_13050 [Paenibacillus beijingensis]